uniref:cystathionine gamma-lyase n=1 Tax=Coccolithus braarudii TaxID=221442 RepID=A0A7S0Q2T5_9EUKA
MPARAGARACAALQTRAAALRLYGPASRICAPPMARRLASNAKTADEQGVAPVGAGVPVGTPRPDWKKYGYATRCASVVKVSDYAARRVKSLSLPIVMGSTYELDNAQHGARLHEKREAMYADGDGYVYSRWGSPTNEGAARQLAALEGVGPDSEGGCMLFSSGMAAISASLMAVCKAGDHGVFPYAVYGGTPKYGLPPQDQAHKLYILNLKTLIDHFYKYKTLHP